jgi:hypothetical protein
MQRRQLFWSRCSPGAGGTLRKREGGPRDQGKRPAKKGEEPDFYIALYQAV